MLLLLHPGSRSVRHDGDEGSRTTGDECDPTTDKLTVMKGFIAASLRLAPRGRSASSCASRFSAVVRSRWWAGKPHGTEPGSCRSTNGSGDSYNWGLPTPPGPLLMRPAGRSR